MDSGAWRSAAHGVSSRTRLSDLTTTTDRRPRAHLWNAPLSQRQLGHLSFSCASGSDSGFYPGCSLLRVNPLQLPWTRTSAHVSCKLSPSPCLAVLVCLSSLWITDCLASSVTDPFGTQTDKAVILMSVRGERLNLSMLAFPINEYGWIIFVSANSSVQFSRSVVSDSLRPHESQHARPPCPSPTPGVHSNSRPSSR